MENYFRERKTKLYFSKDDNVNFPLHIHDSIELVYVIDGGGSAFCNGKSYTLTDGNLFLIFPEQAHSFSNCTDGTYILLILSPSRLPALEDTFRGKTPVTPLAEITPVLHHLLCDAHDEFRKTADECVVDGYLTAFFGKLFQSLPLQSSRISPDTVTQILQYCAHHYREDIHQQDLCNLFHVSPSYISHLFSKQLKIAFPEYLNSLRLDKAISLLRSSSLNMTQVSEKAGFASIRSFNRVFLKAFGYPPREYRKRTNRRNT